MLPAITLSTGTWIIVAIFAVVLAIVFWPRDDPDEWHDDIGTDDADLYSRPAQDLTLYGHREWDIPVIQDNSLSPGSMMSDVIDVVAIPPLDQELPPVAPLGTNFDVSEPPGTRQSVEVRPSWLFGTHFDASEPPGTVHPAPKFLPDIKSDEAKVSPVEPPEIKPDPVHKHQEPDPILPAHHTPAHEHHTQDTPSHHTPAHEHHTQDTPSHHTPSHDSGSSHHDSRPSYDPGDSGSSYDSGSYDLGSGGFD